MCLEIKQTSHFKTVSFKIDDDVGLPHQVTFVTFSFHTAFKNSNSNLRVHVLYRLNEFHSHNSSNIIDYEQFRKLARWTEKGSYYFTSVISSNLLCDV